VDFGLITEPEGAWNDPRSGWTIENHGVDPDIVVENQPTDVAKGVDAQLDRAIEEVMRLRGQQTALTPKLDLIRNRTREAFKAEMGQ
jgi:tricorn protease